MVQRKYVQRGHAQPGFNYLGSRYMREREREVAGEGVRGVVVVFGARACLRTYRRLRIVVLLQITEQLKFPPSGRDFRPKWAEIPSTGRKSFLVVDLVISY